MPGKDIVNISGVGTGTQKQGVVTVHTPGRGSAARAAQFQRDSQHTIDIPTISGKYDTRFDDPRYYNGDTIG